MANARTLHRHMPNMDSVIPVEEVDSDTIRILGDWGSPYTMKMLAVLRFYRSPHRYVTGAARAGMFESGLERPRPCAARHHPCLPPAPTRVAHPRVRPLRYPPHPPCAPDLSGARSGRQLAPTFYFGDEPMVDSTPIIARMEAEGVGGRSLVHPDPALQFLSKLIEDFGDEWCTKMMYHYRWDLDADQEKASNFLMLSSNPALPERALQERATFIRERQVGRLDFVGSNP